MNEAEQRLRIAIQKNDGRIGQDSLGLLSAADFKFQVEDRVDICDVNNFPLTIEFSRNADIPDDVQRGFCDFGIVGSDRIEEGAAKVIVLLPLGFGKCKLQLGVRNDITYSDPNDLQNLRIATSFPNLSRKFLVMNNVSADLIIRAGKIEKYVKQGRAEACIDITSSGRSMRNNGIKPYNVLLESEAMLIANPLLRESRGREKLVEELLISIISALRVRDFTMMVMNAPDSARKAIVERLPSADSPTITPLDKPGWWSISSVVPRGEFRNIRMDLQEIGARAILGCPLGQIAPNRDDRVIMEMMEKIYD